MLSATSLRAPALTAVTAISAATPITTPTAVRTARNQFAWSESSAIRHPGSHPASSISKWRSTGPSDTIRPSATRTMRAARCATSSECVTRTTVVPCRFSSSSSPSTSSALAEVARRLVGEENLGTDDERPRDPDALLLTARELVRSMAESICEPHLLQRLGHTRPSLARRRPRRSAAAPRSCRPAGAAAGCRPGRRSRSPPHTCAALVEAGHLLPDEVACLPTVGRGSR